MLQHLSRTALLLSVTMLSACQTRSDTAPGVAREVEVAQQRPPEAAGQNTTRASEPSENIDELGRHANLLVRPASALWLHQRLGNNDTPDLPGPTDYALIAVLEFGAADAEAISSAPNVEAPKPANVHVLDWFPDALKKLATPDRDGKLILKGQRLPVQSYFRAPLTNGTLTRVDQTNYFVLDLFTT